MALLGLLDHSENPIRLCQLVDIMGKRVRRIRVGYDDTKVVHFHFGKGFAPCVIVEV
jgi:hypothetical protein